jgi:hypothetical protein
MYLMRIRRSMLDREKRKTLLKLAWNFNDFSFLLRSRTMDRTLLTAHTMKLINAFSIEC